MKKQIALIVVSFVVSMVLCVTVLIPFLKKHDPVYQAASTPAPTKTVTVTPPPATASATPTETKDPTNAKYGQAYAYPNGLKVTVSQPKSYPKDPSVSMKRKYYKLFKVTVKNTASTTFPRTGDMYVEVDGGAGDYQATEGNGVPETSIKPGQTLTFTVVYGVDTNHPVFGLAMSPLWEVDPVITWGN